MEEFGHPATKESGGKVREALMLLPDRLVVHPRVSRECQTRTMTTSPSRFRR
jgi:hypothetical protein